MTDAPAIASALPPPPAAGDVAAWRAAILELPIEAREVLSPLLDPRRLRVERLRELQGLLVSISARSQGSERAVARAVRGELLRYASTRWPYERGRLPGREHRLAHRFLTLNRGEVPSDRTVRRILSEAGPTNFGGGPRTSG